MKTVEPGPAKGIWLHLLKVGEWQRVDQIREGVPHLAHMSGTLADMVEAKTLSVRKVNARVHEYAVTPTTRVPRGVTLVELMAAMPGLGA